MQGSSARSIKAFHKSSKTFVWQSLQQSTCYSAIRFRFKSHVFRTNIGPRLSTTRQNCTFFAEKCHVWLLPHLPGTPCLQIGPEFSTVRWGCWSTDSNNVIIPTRTLSVPPFRPDFCRKKPYKRPQKAFKRLLKALLLSKVNVEMEPRKRWPQLCA